MRPVDKGPAPGVTFQTYQDAEPYLEQRLGAYCSYCEFPISHVPEVEHKEAKGRGGKKLEWNNLLLSCKYCNTRESKIIGKGEKDRYIWPDEDDTFHAYTYHDGHPKLNIEYLNQQVPQLKEKAENLYNILKLDNRPIKPNDKDRRYSKRSEAYNCAMESLEDWKKIQTEHDKEKYLTQTERLAVALGFFSVWMEVFKNYPEVRNRLINIFPGTKAKYCDDI